MTSAASAKRLENWCDDGDEFEEILHSAIDAAKPGKEEEFCLDIESKWDSNGLRMYMSEAQWEWLNRLADKA